MSQKLKAYFHTSSAAIHCSLNSQTNNANEFNRLLEFATYGQGETIVSEGTNGDSMFMICNAAKPPLAVAPKRASHSPWPSWVLVICLVK